MQNQEKKMEERKEFIKRLIEEKEKENKKLPHGNVRAIKHGKGYQYYLRDESNDPNGKYIPRKELKWVRKMIQREYNEKVVERAREELKLIEKMEKYYQHGCVEDIYEKFAQGKQVLIKAVACSTEQFLSEWLNTEYDKLPFRENSPEYYSNKGERMRSKSEVIIANLLDKWNVPYLYEKPLTLNNGRVVHPDFTIIDAERKRVIYWEHLGMLDDEEYLEKAILKIRQYEETGLCIGKSLIITGESSRQPMDVRLVEKQIRSIFEQE